MALLMVDVGTKLAMAIQVKTRQPNETVDTMLEF